MKSTALGILLVTVALAGVPAQAQTSLRLRGTITAVDATTLSVKSREGRDLKLALPESVTVAVAKAATFADLKAGDFVGTTTRPGPDGTEVAVEVHYLAPTVTPGQMASDLAPNSKMTNASVQGKVTGTANHELTLQFPGGTQKVVVPQGTPIVRTVPGSRADLVPGEYVFVSGQTAGDGAMTALRIQVSKDGVRPPQ
jgi:hypothetical protein